ncbi:MAG: uroporphyrinogen-III synthase [Betaproteobacteria bacterium]|nr:uroporphyrinogen-III synthase [Betaproteobacteria bacterium]MBV9360535.1 uroporphyrinogen-III synthase [Betaproteobacteria bacterium]
MSLAGRGVVLTRPRELAQAFAKRIESRGARAIVFPTIEIQPLPAPAVLRDVARFDFVVFVSPSAVRVARTMLPPWPSATKAVAISFGTKRELDQAGIAPVIVPQSGADSEAVLAAPELEQVSGKRVLIIRGDDGRPVLGDSLAARGAKVEYAECYRRVRPAADPAPLVAAGKRGEVHAVVALSAQALGNFIDMTQSAFSAATPFFVSHERIARHAKALGVREVVVAATNDDAMIERLVAYFDGRN